MICLICLILFYPQLCSFAFLFYSTIFNSGLATYLDFYFSVVELELRCLVGRTRFLSPTAQPFPTICGLRMSALDKDCTGVVLCNLSREM